MEIPSARRVRNLLVALLTAGGLLGIAAPAAAGEDGPGHGGHGRTYLALGDSVSFGFRGGQAPEVYADPDNFVGYPDLVAEDLGLRLLNASCPGETTDSFIDPEAQSNGCSDRLGSEAGHRDLFPLHVDYAGSQLEYAVEALEEEPRVRLVTLQLGANDLLVCQQVVTDYCSGPTDVEGVAAHVRENLDLILSALRDEAGYTGRIVVVTYYSLDYADPNGTAAVQAVNAAMTAAALAHGATVASGFLAFQPEAERAGGSPVEAGLVLPGDIHPSAAGHRRLATAVEDAVGH